MSVARLASISVLLAIALAIAAHADEARAPQKFALLVGVNKYSDLTPLECAAKDQWALAERLRKAGFPADQIIVLASQTPSGQNNDDVKRLPIQRNVLKWLSNVVDLTRKGDMLIVAFSGHGIQIGEHNYLCPIDADPEYPEADDDQRRTAQCQAQGLRRRAQAIGAGRLPR